MIEVSRIEQWLRLRVICAFLGGGMTALLLAQCAPAPGPKALPVLVLRLDRNLSTDGALGVGRDQVSLADVRDVVDVSVESIADGLSDLRIVERRGGFEKRLAFRLVQQPAGLSVLLLEFESVEVATGTRWVALDSTGHITLSRMDGTVCLESTETVILRYEVTGTIAGSGCSQLGALRLPWCSAFR